MVFRRPIIIALDQDNFYCGVERVLNPALCGKPVGITQKSLLATTSYEARARGVTKLMRIRRAKELVPDMILVDGEDLTNYRRFSKRVERLVGAIVGVTEGGERAVEKLGLDEVFVDVTTLVYDHIDEISSSWQSSESIFFQLPSSSQALFPDKHPPGFTYNPSSLPGHVLAPASRPIVPGPTSTDIHSQALLIAGHLAAFIRKKIKDLIGLTSSAGVARNKLLAKLVASIKKPDAQTTFLAESVRQGGDVEVDGDDEEMVQKFLDSMELRKVNGFGSKTISILTDDMDVRSVPYELPLTVSQTRQLLTLGDFTRLYKDQPRLGPRLWGLLHGIDEDPVRPNPEYPKQISVEDSYARTMKRSLRTIRGQMLALIEDLLRRLEDELMDDAPGESGWLLPPAPVVRDRAMVAKPTWKRYPRQFRLALRLDWDHPGGRDSKSTIMPAFIFDTARSVSDRADALMSKIGSSLLSELLGTKKGDKVDEKTEFAVYVINVAAVNMALERPPPSLSEGWTSNIRASDIDEDFLDSLPADIRAELTGHPEPQTKIRKRNLLEPTTKPTKPLKRTKTGAGFSATQAIEIEDDEPEVIVIDATPVRPVQRPFGKQNTKSTITTDTKTITTKSSQQLYGNEISSNNDPLYDEADTTAEFDEIDMSFNDSGTTPSQQLICAKCGTTVFPFAQAAHERWHESQDDSGSTV